MYGPLHDFSGEQFAQILEGAPGNARPALLRERFRTHQNEFCKSMWPERFDLQFNELHEWLFDKQLRTLPWQLRSETERDAIAAPRGYAKSTIETFAKIVHAILYDQEAFVILASAGMDLADKMSGDLRLQFTQSDSPIARLYGPFAVQGGVTGWEVSVCGRPSVAVKPASVGSAVRGARHPSRGLRPTLVVIDDGEDKIRVRSPEQRKLWWEWLTKDVLKLGRRQGGTIYRIVGTILHHESGLARLFRDIGWSSRRWQAIIAWPERADLWAQCGAIWSDLSLGTHRRAAAKAFYAKNRSAMDRGSKTLDPKTKSLFELYEQIWSEGLSSFLQEMQNDPRDPTAQIFFSENFARFYVRGRDLVIPEARDPHGQILRPERTVPIASLKKFGRWDPALGSAHGDYAAIAILGRDDLGYTYVLACWMARAKPSEQLAAAWSLCEVWGCQRMSVEGNGFQKLVMDEYPRQQRIRRDEGRFWRMQLQAENTCENKEMRIATLEPGCTQGWILFNTAVHQSVLDQFDAFPTGSHDDGPDAIQASWDALGGVVPGMVA